MIGWMKKIKSMFVKEVVVYVPVSTVDKHLSMEALNARLTDLINSHYWDLFEEILMEMHDRKTKELVGCKTIEDMHYVRGSISMLNMLLTFKVLRKSLSE